VRDPELQPVTSIRCHVQRAAEPAEYDHAAVVVMKHGEPHVVEVLGGVIKVRAHPSESRHCTLVVALGLHPHHPRTDQQCVRATHSSGDMTSACSCPWRKQLRLQG
jgi:hypothetical protein